MHSEVGELIPVVAWSGETFRLIPSRFPPVSIYEGLVANDRMPDLVTIENLTNPRLRSEARIASQSGTDPKASALLQNWNLAPFAYGNPDGSLFYDEETPCLEVATDRQTALAMSVAKRQRFLECTGEEPIGLDMRMLKTPVEGRFADLRVLDADAVRMRGRELGARLPDDADGFLFHPTERPTATAISVVKSRTLQRTLQTTHYRYMWDGKRITKLYAFDGDGTVIEAESLRGKMGCLAA